MITLARLLLFNIIEIFEILCFLYYIVLFLLGNIIELLSPVVVFSRTFSATAAAALDVDLMLKQ